MKPLVSARLPTEAGNFEVHAFESGVPSQPHLMLCSKKQPDGLPLVRVHSECWTGDVMGSLRCDCGPQLDSSLNQVQKEGGAVLYLRQEGRGIGLVNKIRVYALQDQGHDTVEANEILGFPADLREYNICLDIMQHFNISSVNLITNNPKN